jgi:hypothetical protein
MNRFTYSVILTPDEVDGGFTVNQTAKIAEPGTTTDRKRRLCSRFLAGP